DTAAAADGYAKVLAGKPTDDLAARATFRLGTALYRLGRAEEAEPLLSEATDGKRTRPEFRPALLCLGGARFQKGRWAEAERSLGDYLAVAAESADDALLKYALCAARQARPADAVSRLDDLIGRFPDSPLAARAQFEKGQSLQALGRPDEAKTAFEAAVAQD